VVLHVAVGDLDGVDADLLPSLVTSAANSMVMYPATGGNLIGIANAMKLCRATGVTLPQVF
jgi:hypothetical protein